MSQLHVIANTFLWLSVSYNKSYQLDESIVTYPVCHFITLSFDDVSCVAKYLNSQVISIVCLISIQIRSNESIKYSPHKVFSYHEIT